MTLNAGNKRPTFLKVLCILSFIGCGIMILFDLFAIIFSLIVDSGEINEADRNNPMHQALFFMAHTGNEHVKGLIVEMISLAGILLMWKLKKIGFIIYVIAESFLYFKFIYLIFTLSLDFPNAMGIGIDMIWPFPFDLAFFIMYATQLKFMTWSFKSAI
jgi:hypothetical protein